MRARQLLFGAFVGFARVAWPQGEPLGPEFRVNTYTTSFQTDPSVAADSSGNFVVVWHSLGQDGSGYGVFGQRYAGSGIPLGPEFRVNTYTTAHQRYPSVAADSIGNFVVAWQDETQDGSGRGVFAQRYDSSGAPLGPEFRVNTYTTSSQYHPSVAVAAGNFVVVWHSTGQDGSSHGVFGQRYAIFGTPLGPEFRVNAFTTSSQAAASVTADSSGNFVVVWASYTQDGDLPGIFGQRFARSGIPLGPEFRVNTYTTGIQAYPSVAAAGDNFVVVWESHVQDGSGTGVFGQRHASSGTPVGPEFRVNTYTTSFQHVPSVGADGSGNFVVVWHSVLQDGSGFGVFGQRYNRTSTGLPSGPEFRVNTYTTESQYVAAVAAGTSGNFVVVWTSNAQDGSSAGIFGRRYSQIVPVDLLHFRVE